MPPEPAGPRRPLVHLTPPAGWLNDPNGLVHHDGEWHLCYQHHPASTRWGPMHWGHAVSRDLVSFTHLPVALAPDAQGTIFSGSAIVDVDDDAGFGAGTLLAFFTSHRDGDRGQALAWSTDRGRTWTKHPDNPLVLPPDDGPDFRDPAVLRYRSLRGDAWWVMVVAAGDRLCFYRSEDLRTWTPTSTFRDPLPHDVGVFETPELVELPVAGTDGTRWVLSVGHLTGGPGGGSGSRYLVGSFDGERFTPDDPAAGLRWSDHGADFYAPQAWANPPDARRVWVGWLSNWAYANEVPADTWRGTLSIPRELGLIADGAGGQLLTQWPVRELATALRPVSARRPASGCLDPADAEVAAALAAVAPDRLALTLHLDVGVGQGALRLWVPAGNGGIELAYDPTSRQLRLTRVGGMGGVSPDPGARQLATLPAGFAPGTLLVLVDGSGMEVFAASGTVVLSCLLPGDGSGGSATLAWSGSVRVAALEVAEVVGGGPVPEG